MTPNKPKKQIVKKIQNVKCPQVKTNVLKFLKMYF